MEFKKWHVAKDLKKTKEMLYGVLERGGYTKEMEALAISFFGIARFLPHLTEKSLERALKGNVEKNKEAIKKSLVVFAIKGEGKQRAMAIALYMFLLAWKDFLEKGNTNVFLGNKGVNALVGGCLFYIAYFGVKEEEKEKGK